MLCFVMLCYIVLYYHICKTYIYIYIHVNIWAPAEHNFGTSRAQFAHQLSTICQLSTIEHQLSTIRTQYKHQLSTIEHQLSTIWAPAEHNLSTSWAQFEQLSTSWEQFEHQPSEQRNEKTMRKILFSRPIQIQFRSEKSLGQRSSFEFFRWRCPSPSPALSLQRMNSN